MRMQLIVLKTAFNIKTVYSVTSISQFKIFAYFARCSLHGNNKARMDILKLIHSLAIGYDDAEVHDLCTLGYSFGSRLQGAIGMASSGRCKKRVQYPTLMYPNRSPYTPDQPTEVVGVSSDFPRTCR